MAQNPTPQQQLRQILDKLDQILAAAKAASVTNETTKSSGEGQEDNYTLRWDQTLPAAQRFIILPAFNSDAVLDKRNRFSLGEVPAVGRGIFVKCLISLRE
jgi:hypothetical protein